MSERISAFLSEAECQVRFLAQILARQDSVAVTLYIQLKSLSYTTVSRHSSVLKTAYGTVEKDAEIRELTAESDSREIELGMKIFQEYRDKRSKSLQDSMWDYSIAKIS